MEGQKCPDCNHEHLPAPNEARQAGKKADGTCKCGCQTQPSHKATAGEEGNKK